MLIVRTPSLKKAKSSRLPPTLNQLWRKRGSLPCQSAIRVRMMMATPSVAMTTTWMSGLRLRSGA